MGPTKRIGTHNGTFHCDEALACFLLKQLPEFEKAEIVRTRDQSTLDTCDVVVDVGGVYDLEKMRFDHHQKSFNETMNSLRPSMPEDIRLSSAGLVYHHFGEQIIAKKIQRPVDDADTQIIFKKIYEELILEIDAIDNGVKAADTLRYRIRTHLSARVGGLNPRWNQDQSPELVNAKFEEAMQMVGAEFLDKVEYYSEGWLPAKMIVREAIEKRFEVHDSGKIIELGVAGCPWKDHLFALEEELKIQNELKYVIFEDTTNKSYRVQGVPADPLSFDLRLPLPWKGLRDDDLSRESGIPGGVFVHVTGFIGGNKTRDGALEMAKLALKNETL